MNEQSMPYCVATEEEKVGVCSEYYDLLLFPDGEWCFLGEPEDRTWDRDAKAVVRRLNEQHYEIQRLRSALESIRDRKLGHGYTQFIAVHEFQEIATKALEGTP